MLQQTQVDRVVPKYHEFMSHWSTVEELAEADTTHLLGVWSGLGYNNRAIRLRAAAAQIVEKGWPRSVAGLQDLPGVGPYTAGAIASIAFGESVPAIDTNVRRVISRWEGEPLTGSYLTDMARSLLGDPPGDWNQAMMDLGSSLCRPKNARCAECPVEPWCSDPDVYEPPSRQSTFEGSRRQLRGALVRAHVNGADLSKVGSGLGRSEDEIRMTIEDLITEGLLPSEG
jgi:A/G-specific adenine glycosylase